MHDQEPSKKVLKVKSMDREPRDRQIIHGLATQRQRLIIFVQTKRLVKLGKSSFADPARWKDGEAGPGIPAKNDLKTHSIVGQSQSNLPHRRLDNEYTATAVRVTGLILAVTSSVAVLHFVPRILRR